MSSYWIVLEKEKFKFSCSHFTILGPSHAERLHGHNYYVGFKILTRGIDPALGMAFDFNLVKPLVQRAVEELDERVLLPKSSPFLKVENSPQSTAVTLGSKHYVFPTEDVKLLPVVNVTSEELARYISEVLVSALKQTPGAREQVSEIAVSVEETRGQKVILETKL